jgi:GT2 family glycosyltransferase
MNILNSFRDRLPHVRVVDASATRGPGAARTAGVRAARAECILFCDADDQVGEGWLAAMADALRNHEFVAAQLDTTLLNSNPSLRPQVNQPGLLQSQPPFRFPYMMGCALGVRRALHDRLGGFDETFRHSGEDRDYCYRAQLSGITLLLVPEAVVHYRYRETLLAYFQQSRAYGVGHLQVYRAYRHLGMPRTSRVRALVSWLLFLPQLLPALTSYARLMTWMGSLGWRIGLLEAGARSLVQARADGPGPFSGHRSPMTR